jgi:hypothetical protein
MWQDPIVEEVRKAGEELARRANYDLHTFFENLRKNQNKRNARVVSRVKNETVSRLDRETKSNIISN